MYSSVLNMVKKLLGESMVKISTPKHGNILKKKRKSTIEYLKTFGNNSNTNLRKVHGTQTIFEGKLKQYSFYQIKNFTLHIEITIY